MRKDIKLISNCHLPDLYPASEALIWSPNVSCSRVETNDICGQADYLVYLTFILGGAGYINFLRNLSFYCLFFFLYFFSFILRRIFFVKEYAIVLRNQFIYNDKVQLITHIKSDNPNEIQKHLF